MKDLYSFLSEKGLTPVPASEGVQSTNDDRLGGSGDGAPAASGNAHSLAFTDPNIANALAQASERELDSAPFGIVKVDDEGIIQFYNRYESELAGVAPQDAVGRNFFTQVAPCGNNRLFYGRFKKGVREGNFDETFSYTFTYKMRPTLVDIRVLRSGSAGNWVLVRKR